MELKTFLKSAASVVPSQRQLDWYDTEFYCFVHFGVNTYTDREWGLGIEDPAIFDPSELDCDQWVEAVKAAGMRGLVLTAKHHDGFCLWPSAYTEHSIKNSPFRGGKGDIVREAAEACRRGGIKFGFYLSPWDRNSKLYGTDDYNDYYKAQLTELLTNYGDIFYVWFDGACGEGPQGRVQEYDFEGYIELVRKYHPNAVIFHDQGPDVRWCGNESGTVRHAEWAVVPHELCPRAARQTEGAPLEGDLSYLYNTHADIGALSNILYSKGLCFCGAEVDMSIRPGWFYHENESPHSLDRLFDTYLASVGGNCCFNLNVPPTKKGLFDEEDVVRLRELGTRIRGAFSDAKPYTLTRIDHNDTQVTFQLDFAERVKMRYIVLQEDIAKGQRVESFLIKSRGEYGDWREIYEGTCIGNKKICAVSGSAEGLQIYITGARDTVEMKEILVY